MVSQLSRGQTQRIGLARTLLHDPQVLLLDEPASGLDPRARIEMRGLLKELRNMGKTILVSSHILPELADICNKIGIIERGQLLFDGDVQSAIRQVRQHTVYLVAVANEQNARAHELLEAHLDVLKVEPREEEGCLRVTLNDGVHDGSFIPEMILQNGMRLKMFKEEEIDLEDVFMGITKGITN
jgi:ABC-2 type transport system ATP-binding protein